MPVIGCDDGCLIWEWFLQINYLVHKGIKMKKPRLFLTGIPGMVVFVLTALYSPTAGAYTILTPPAGHTVLVHARRAESYMVIKAESESEARSLQVGRVVNMAGGTDSLKSSGTSKKDGAYYVHYLLPLKNGSNTFIVNPGRRDVKIRYQPLLALMKLDPNDPATFLFHRNEVIPRVCAGCHDRKLPAGSGLNIKKLQKNPDFSPVCYSCHRKLASKSKWMHSPTANLYCMTCHRKGDGNEKISILPGRVGKTCYRCHINKRKLKTMAYVHGPAAIGDCTVCHDPHGDRYPFQLWADPRVDVCVACHTDKQKTVKKVPGFYGHGIINGYGCAACHDPHASDNRFQLYKPINDLCVGCHIGLQGVTQGHPVGKHPLSGTKDPRRKGREFSCSSCHDPHGSNYQFILIGSPLGGHVCSKCHH